MSIQEITVQFREDETHTSQTITLDGVRFRLDTYTNKWDGCWYLDLYDGDGNALVYAIPLVTGLDLLFPFRYLDVPPGALFINDHEGEREDPGLTTFFDRGAALYYETVL